MRIKVQLSVAGQPVKEDTLELDDGKLEELSEEEIEQAIEINVRSWADRNIAITWETDEE
jgi:hypothetical protein